MPQQADAYRLFIQSMLSRGAVPEKLARTIWKKCAEAVNTVNKHREQFNDTQKAWEDFLKVLNTSLDKLELGFKSLSDQRTGQVVFAIVNLKGDAAAQMATEYTPVEIAYFKALVEQIMIAPRHKYSITSLVAMREVSMIKPKTNITKSQAEIVLSTFVARGWLVKSKSGRYSLSPRSLMELRPYLQTNYAEHVLTCSMCEEILTTGIACAHEGCKCKMHPYCFKRYSRVRANGTLQCKECEQDWPRDIESEGFIPIGEKAVKKGEHEQRVRLGGSSDGEDDDDDYEDVDVDMGSQSQSQPTQTQGRKVSKVKGKKRVAVEDSDEDVPSATSTQRPRRSNRR
ncbi:hypothetical protein AN958_11260 [Leucoagaricus sp. SymC.cos]|nr:hypothetical protein AN958_11260 [Leucoagaricus sp. SymC.cos]